MSKEWVEIRRMPDDDDMVGISDQFCFLFWLRGFSRRSFLCIAQVSVRDINVCEYSQQTLQQQVPKNWLNEIPSEGKEDDASVPLKL
jgi:hypothetical protein